MIFKHLFRSKHQNPNPQVRIQAIEKLNQQDPEQKSILHELAFNDADVNVSLAALQKLDSFVLWYKMAEIAKNERVQKRSQKIVEDILLTEQSGQLDDVEKRKFVLECRDNRLIEKLLMQNWVQQDTELTMQLLQKLAKPAIQEKLLFDCNNESLQLAIVSEMKDGTQQRKLLNKLIKKSQLTRVKDTAQQCLDDWLQAESLPVEIDKQVKMVLSRLLALKESADLPLIKSQQQTLVAEYQKLSSDFYCLAEAKRVEIEQKFADISEKINRHVESLEPLWQAQLAKKELQSNIEKLHTNTKQTLFKVSNQIQQRISDITPVELADFSKEILDHIQTLQLLTKQLTPESRNEHKKIESLHQELLACQNTLDNLPQLQDSLKVGIELIAQFEDLPLPNDQSQIEAAQDFAKDLKHQWRVAMSDYKEFIPDNISAAWNKRNAEWQSAVKELKNQVSANLTRCRNKIRAIDSLVNQGKFKAAMGLYQKVQVWFTALPEKQQSQLEKSYASAKEQIENLQDWQEYIAAPRKPALLKEVDALLEAPLPVQEQAKLIKALRAQWNSLGKLDSEADEALNQAFDQSIEKAFEPCRLHFDKQQKEREQNLISKQNILSKLSELNDSQGSVTEIAKNLRELQKTWQKIGAVDYKLRSEIQEQYQQLLKPITDKINQFYQENQEQKQVLVDKAAKLLELESIDEAIEQVKGLQEKWKLIEHAGRRAESDLWQAFREVNDQIFAKRNAENQVRKEQVKQQVDQVKEKVAEMEACLAQAQDKTDVQTALQAKQEVNELLALLPHSEQKSIVHRIQKAVDAQKTKLTSLRAAEKLKHFKDINSILENWKDDTDLTEQVSVLPKNWQSCFLNVNDKINRNEVLLKMEILADVESPKEEAANRQSIQMQLMAQKLQTGQVLDLNSLYKDWISAGKLSNKSQSDLTRIQRIFLS
ncbi:DUF349 domain-containing protein [Paraglaciecola sp.]|uniref:DUF349 domain-containing protein n=1 Tax=Paraglaciecola sp. TaxID=1920173 RepID=UPI003EF2D69F